MPATQRAPIDYVAGERIGCSAAVFGDFGFVGACDAAHGGRQAAGMQASAQDAWAEYRQRRAMQLRTKQRDWGDGGM